VLRVGSAVLFLCASATAFGLSQENTQRVATSERIAVPVIRVSSQLVVLDVLVKSKKTGAPIDKLEAKDFLVREDGVPQQITAFSRDTLPLSVVFLFDLTYTVRPILKPLAEGASEILGHLKSQDQVAIMVFSSHTELLQDFTRDHSSAATAIAKASDMKSGEGTFIHEDMYEAVDQAMKSTPAESRRVLVWLTDGTANLENSFTQKNNRAGRSRASAQQTRSHEYAAAVGRGSCSVDRPVTGDGRFCCGVLRYAPCAYVCRARRRY